MTRRVASGKSGVMPPHSKIAACCRDFFQRFDATEQDAEFGGKQNMPISRTDPFPIQTPDAALDVPQSSRVAPAYGFLLRNPPMKKTIRHINRIRPSPLPP
jgi:hypothetical protein